MPKVAVLIACFNRRATTLACLDELQRVAGRAGAEVEVWLVDDASTDGTAESVALKHPAVRVLRSDGGLYWARSMNLAWRRALESSAQLFLWLNDDVRLYVDGLERMLREFAARSLDGGPVIVVGSTVNPVTGAVTYGGMARVSRWRLTKTRVIIPGEAAQRCDTMNGNCVLVPRSVVERIGVIDAVFEHGMADLDYGFRATRSGIPIWVVAGFVGECQRNDISGTFADPQIPLRRRWKDILGKKGLPPRSWLVLAFRHGGILWPVIFVWPYLRTILSASLGAATRWRPR